MHINDTVYPRKDRSEEEICMILVVVWDHLGRECSSLQFLKCDLEGEARAPGGHAPLALCTRDMTGGGPEQGPLRCEIQGRGLRYLDVRVVLAFGIAFWWYHHAVLEGCLDCPGSPACFVSALAAQPPLFFHFLHLPGVFSVIHFSV